MKYVHKFNSKLTCTVEILDRQFEPGEHHIIKTEWSERPKKKHIPEYARWMHVVNDNYAKEYDIRLMHVYQFGPRYSDWQIWGYGPDEAPKRLEMLDLPGGPQDIDDFNKSISSLAPASAIYDHQTKL